MNKNACKMNMNINMKRKIWMLWALLLMGAALFVSCSGAFQSKIYMTVSNSSSSSLYDFFQKETQEEALGAPSEMQISKGRFSNKIEVSWDSVKNANAYRLERAVVTETDENGNPVQPKEDDFKTLKATDIYYKTSYTDIILADDETYTSPKFNNYYFYRVCALKTGLETDAGDYFPNYEEPSGSATEGDSTTGGGEATAGIEATAESVSAVAQYYGYLFKPPLTIEADKGKASEGIQVSWSKVDGATKYKINRCETQNGYYYTINTVYANETSYYDEIAEKYQGDEFYYKVSAVNSDGNDSVDSAVAMGYTLQQGAPQAPDNVRVKDGLGTSSVSLFVEWDRVDVESIDGYDASKNNVTYSLYRNTSTDSTYNLLKSNINPDEVTYEDKKVSPGVYYYYYVQTIAEKDGEKIKSAFSDSGKDAKAPAYGFLVTPPSSVEVDDGSSDDKVILRWSPAINVLYETDKKVDYDYKVYYDDSQDGTFTNEIPISSPTETASGKLEVEVDKKNFFAIRTVTPDGVPSAKSEIFAPVPIAPTNITVSKTLGYESIKPLVEKYGLVFSESQWIANSNGVYPLVITWDAPKDDTVAGYNVYCSTSASSGFKKINDATVTQTCYVDNNSTAKAGLFYYYKVVSLNSLGQGTKSNDPSKGDPEHKQRGYGALTLEKWYGEYNENIAKSQSKLTLMHKSSDTAKLGDETKYGDISGTISYNAYMNGLSSAEIRMPYKNYADYFINDDPTLGVKFVLNGSTDTTTSLSADGHMLNTVNLYAYYLDLTGNVGDVFDKLSDSEKQKILDTKDTHYLVGMYPGYVKYDNLEVKSGKAGDGYYLVQTYEIDGCSKDSFGTAKVIHQEGKVDWKVGDKTFKFH